MEAPYSSIYMVMFVFGSSQTMACTAGFRTKEKLKYQDFSPCDTSRAQSAVLLAIRAAAQGIWDGNSPYLSLAPDLHTEARSTFDSRATFEQFHLNWVNVETGGNFNMDHVNVSHQHDGTPERNFGMYQVRRPIVPVYISSRALTIASENKK